MTMMSARQFLATFVPSVTILAAIVAAHFLFQVSLPDMTRDVAAIAKIHPLAGVLSNLGILLWCAAASICLFTATALGCHEDRSVFWFLFCSALLTAYLLFDDCFQIHEDLARRFFGLGQKVVYPVLAILVSAYLIGFRRVILRTRFVALLSALGFLSISVLIDAILAPIFWRFGQSEVVFEDGAKWLGIASWCSYFANTSHQFIVSARCTLILNPSAAEDQTSGSRP